MIRSALNTWTGRILICGGGLGLAAFYIMAKLTALASSI